MLNLTADAGFTAAASPSMADQIQLWTADTKPKSNTYTTYWLSGSGWLPQGGAKAGSVSDSLKIPANRAFFLKVIGPADGRLWGVN